MQKLVVKGYLRRILRFTGSMPPILLRGPREENLSHRTSSRISSNQSLMKMLHMDHAKHSIGATLR